MRQVFIRFVWVVGSLVGVGRFEDRSFKWLYFRVKKEGQRFLERQLFLRVGGFLRRRRRSSGRSFERVQDLKSREEGGRGGFGKSMKQGEIDFLCGYQLLVGKVFFSLVRGFSEFQVSRQILQKRVLVFFSGFRDGSLGRAISSLYRVQGRRFFFESGVFCFYWQSSCLFSQ